SRMGRWNFESDEVLQHLRRNHDGGYLQFDLPWLTPPKHSDLRLFVRFTTFDGRRLESNLPIDVQVAKTDSDSHDWKKLSTASKSEAETAAWSDSAGPSLVKNLESPSSDENDAQSDTSVKPQRTARRPSWSPNR